MSRPSMRRARAASKRVEYGDFQTPDALAARTCSWLVERGVRPQIVVEPTCGVGAMLGAAAAAFPQARVVRGFEVERSYVEASRERLRHDRRIEIEQADFFTSDWRARLAAFPGELLVIGNFPWVTNSAQGTFDGANLPRKSNFQHRRGIDAITGAANFDVSEWMLIEACSWFEQRSGWLAMLCKRSVARRVIGILCERNSNVAEVALVEIDAKREFDASVAACLWMVRFDGSETDAAPFLGDHRAFASFADESGILCGRRDGISVRDLARYERHRHRLGESPVRWRSGVKHDAAAVMEFTRHAAGFINGKGVPAAIESALLFPLLKGAEIGSGRPWSDRFVLLPQRRVGEPTEPLRESFPQSYAYLVANAAVLDARRSTIYRRNPRFSIFGIGDYAFRPWKIAVCGLYKRVRFRLVGPIESKPVMFDDTTTYLAFDSENEARAAFAVLESQDVRELLESMIFPDDKRPVKAAILNRIDWTRSR